MKFLFDTNCYLSYFLTRNEIQHKKISSLMESISRSKYELILTSHNLSEINFVLETVYNLKKDTTKKILVELLENPGVRFECGYFPDIVFDIWQTKIKDYGDAVLASAGIHWKIPVITFDKTFQKEMDHIGLPRFDF
jgi:predicted nucleic-acid-binding protein